MRYGHAMGIPAPGLRSHAALRALAQPQRRVHFAHTDVSGTSVFEEAMYQGARSAAQIVRLSAAPTKHALLNAMPSSGVRNQ